VVTFLVFVVSSGLCQNTLQTCLVVGLGEVVASHRRDGGEQSLHVFGGQYGKKGMEGALRIDLALYRKLRVTVLPISIIWCKEHGGCCPVGRVFRISVISFFVLLFSFYHFTVDIFLEVASITLSAEEYNYKFSKKN